MQQILIRKKEAAYIPTYKLTGSYSPVSKELLGTFLKNLESIGWILSGEFLETLKKSSSSRLQGFYNDLLDELKIATGAHATFTPLFPNFPNTLMNDSESDEYLIQYSHYLSAGDWLPDTPVSQQMKLADPKNLKTLNFATKEDLVTIGLNLLKQRNSLSPSDVEDLTAIINWSFNHSEVQFKEKAQEYFLNRLDVPFKENLMVYLSILKGQKEIDKNFNYNFFAKHSLKTATDVLRYLVAISGGDVSLAEPTKFNISSSDRKLAMNALQTIMARNSQDVIDSFHKYSEEWKRVGEKVHPRGFSKNYQTVKQMFQDLRENKLQKSFSQATDTYTRQSDFIKAAKVLATRPGELARKLDYLLRNSSSEDQKEIVGIWNEVAGKIPAKNLLELWKYFSTRSKIEHRIIFPKGGEANMWVQDYTPYPIESETLEILNKGLETELNRKMFIKTEKPGRKIFIDEILSNINIPFAGRSESKQLRALSRGSRIPVDLSSGNIRLFTYWKQACDLDLSGILLTEDLKTAEYCTFTRLGNSCMKHSGDITNGSSGACEFIDVDVNLAKQKGKYLLLSLNSFSKLPFSEYHECFSGFTTDTGKTFNPVNAPVKFDLTSNSKGAVSLAIDLETSELIWLDLACFGGAISAGNITSTFESILKGMLKLQKPTLVNLLDFWVKANNHTIVDSPNEADEIFGEEWAFKREEILSRFL